MTKWMFTKKEAAHPIFDWTLADPADNCDVQLKVLRNAKKYFLKMDDDCSITTANRIDDLMDEIKLKTIDEKFHSKSEEKRIKTLRGEND